MMISGTANLLLSTRVIPHAGQVANIREHV